MAQIKIASARLNKSLREQLALDRVQLTFPSGKSAERCDYLKSEGMVVEPIESSKKFLVTFFKAQRPLLEAVQSKWEDIIADKERAHLRYSCK